jgi:hypothetical protein
MTCVRLLSRLRPGQLACLMTYAWLYFAAISLPVHADAPAFVGQTTLLMVDDINCSYCRKWEREVGVGYGKSVEGRFAPLTKVRRGDPRLQGITSLAYTPTFILFVNGREAGRIVGYPGADFFWAELDQMIKRGGFAAPSDGQRADLMPPSARTS